MPIVHPPKPRLTLRIGIAGHRPDKLRGEAVGRIAGQLRSVFAAIDTAAKDILVANKECFADEPPVVRLLSGFAEGADQLAVEACPDGWQVEAILPFPKNEYVGYLAKDQPDPAGIASSFEKLLASAKTLTELSPGTRQAPGHQHHDEHEARHRGRGYADAGTYFLAQLDVLIAVWDGKPPKTGGTGAMARHAFEGGIPVVWLSLEQNEPARLIKGFDKHGDPVAPEPDASAGPLAAALHVIFGPPAESDPEGGQSPRARLLDYYQETWREGCSFVVYDCLKRLATWQRPRLVIRFHPFEQLCREWEKFIADTPNAEDLRARIRRVLLPRFVWADTLAIYFSHQYRSTYVLAYMLSAAAVFVALGGLFKSDAKAVFVVIELVIVGIIIWMIWYGRRWRWHERWLDYRALAENLRHCRFLAFAGEFGRARQPSKEANRSESSWVLWYLRATLREVGLPTALLDETYQWKLLNATLGHEIEEQLKYHKANITSASNIDRLLHWSGVFCFYFTAAFLCIFLLAYIGSYFNFVGPLDALKSVMTLASAGLPALGAALAGIRVHGDFEGSKERSVYMVDALNAHKQEYTATINRGITLNETAEMLLKTARVMSEDIAAWQALYGRKRLNLPT
jgi:hypothetical protein